MWLDGADGVFCWKEELHFLVCTLWAIRAMERVHFIALLSSILGA
jgi:hypothetical protein